MGRDGVGGRAEGSRRWGLSSIHNTLATMDGQSLQTAIVISDSDSDGQGRRRQNAVLGVDPNMHCTGVAVLNENGSILDWCCIESDVSDTSLSFVKKLQQYIVSIDCDYNITRAFVEDFQRGGSRVSKKILAQLGEAHGMVQATLMCTLNIATDKINAINVISARSNLGIENRGGQIKDRVIAYAGCQAQLEASSHVLNKFQSASKEQQHNMADAYIIAKGGMST